MNRVALLERAEEILVVVDAEVGVVAALHEDSGASDRQGLLDLLEDDRLRKQVPLGAVARTPEEGAEVAVGDADVRVIDVAVDDERDPARVRAAASRLVRSLSDGHQVLGLEERHGLVVGDALAVQGLVEDRRYARQFSTCFRSFSTTAEPVPVWCPYTIAFPFVFRPPDVTSSCLA